MKAPYIFQHRFFLGAVVSLLFFSFYSCDHPGDDTEATKKPFVLPDSLSKRLQVSAVTFEPFRRTLELTGKVNFNEDKVIRIFPLVSGVVQDVKVMLGDQVHKGEELAVIRSSEMAGYSTDLITARANLEVAKKNWDATKDMYQSGLASSGQYVSAQAAYEQAKATLLKSQRVLSINGGTTNGNYYVKSPIDGFIVERQINNGMALRPDNSTDLFTVSDLKTVWVYANLYESNLPYVRVGDTASVATIAYPDRLFYGRVDKITHVLDSSNKVARVRIVLSNPGYLLKPEMFANVTIAAKADTAKKMLAVPTNAVIFDNSQYYVITYGAKGSVSIRGVQVAGKAGNTTYLSAGVSEGEKVVTSDSFLIYQQLNS